MEQTLANGARVRTRSMPVHVYQMYMNIEEARIGSPPNPPVIEEEQQSLAGHTETIKRVAEEGDPGYAEWEAEMDAWTERSREARAEGELRWIGVLVDYGITEWMWPGTDDTWQSEPPDDWEFPAALARGGLEPSDNNRLDYILLELLTHADDYSDVLSDIYSGATPITNEEVQAQTAGFRLAGESEGAARGDGDRSVDLSRRDGNSQELGFFARLLGQRN